MTAYQYIPDDYHLTYGQHLPALIIQPEDKVFTRLADAHGYDERAKKVTGSPNPLTGPFVVKGAQPGNILSVTIDSLAPNRTSGWASQSLHPNVFDYSNAVYQKDYIEWELDLQGRKAIPRGQVAPLNYLEIPFAPVLGCIGVAPGAVENARSVDCGRYGGNMDLCTITTGITLYLPVFVEGAYLFFGDGHATQGAGEITGNGIEVSFDLQFSIDILKGNEYNRLRAKDQTWIYSIANERPLEEACRQATEGMAAWLVEDYGFQPGTPGLLMGQVVDYKLGNLVSNVFTAACAIEHKFLSKLV